MTVRRAIHAALLLVGACTVWAEPAAPPAADPEPVVPASAVEASRRYGVEAVDNAWGEVVAIQRAWHEADETSLGVPVTAVLDQPWFLGPSTTRAAP